MDEKETCVHCGGDGVCNKVKDNASCSDCIEASGLDMAYYKCYVPCAVCKGKGIVNKKGEPYTLI